MNRLEDLHRTELELPPGCLRRTFGTFSYASRMPIRVPVSYGLHKLGKVSSGKGKTKGECEIATPSAISGRRFWPPTRENFPETWRPDTGYFAGSIA